MNFKENDKLFEISSTAYSTLATALNRNNAWRRILEFAEIFDPHQVHTISTHSHPGLGLLEELGSRLCEVRHLRFLLRECALFEVLSLISEPEKLQIAKQPTEALKGREKMLIKVGEVFCLEFLVSGLPPPTYAWLKDGKMLKGQDSSLLRYEEYSPDLEGIYTCLAIQHLNGLKEDEVVSDSVTIETFPEPPIIIERPPSHISLCEGSPILLSLEVSGYPQPTFQWLQGNTVLQDQTDHVLFIPESSLDHSGQYKCYISNKAKEIIVEVNVTIYAENSVSIFDEPVSTKIALLIGNDKYENLKDLNTPVNDVKELALILKKLGFTTLCFRNLNLYETTVAVELLANMVEKGAYVIFYYAGHGFECGDHYILPVDSPDTKTYLKKNAYSESQLLFTLLEKQPALCLILLDMCLQIPDKFENENIYKETTDIFSYKSERNLIRGYSTTSHNGAYERENDYNGIYVSALKKHLNKKLPILAILGRVNKDITQLCPKQMPTVSYNTAQDFYLGQEVIDEHEYNLYKKLSIEETVEYFDSVKISLRKYLVVYNNAVEIEIGINKDLLQFESNWKMTTCIPFQESTFLVIEELQKLEESLKIVLKINSCEYVITLPKSFKLNKFFEDV